MKNIAIQELVKAVNQSSRLRINARRRLDSIIGPRIKPNTNGPKGTPAFLSPKPARPAAYITHTSVIALFRANEPTVPNRMIPAQSQGSGSFKAFAKGFAPSKPITIVIMAANAMRKTRLKTKP